MLAAVPGATMPPAPRSDPPQGPARGRRRGPAISGPGARAIPTPFPRKNGCGSIKRNTAPRRVLARRAHVQLTKGRRGRVLRALALKARVLRTQGLKVRGRREGIRRTRSRKAGGRSKAGGPSPRWLGRAGQGCRLRRASLGSRPLKRQRRARKASWIALKACLAGRIKALNLSFYCPLRSRGQIRPRPFFRYSLAQRISRSWGSARIS